MDAVGVVEANHGPSCIVPVAIDTKVAFGTVNEGHDPLFFLIVLVEAHVASDDHAVALAVPHYRGDVPYPHPG